MRVTNLMLINTVLRDLYSNNQRMMRIQDQVASGRIVNNPSEDPLISDKVIGLELAVARAAQFLRNGKTSTAALYQADSSLGEVTGMATTARTLAVHMANGTATAQQRAISAEEIDQILAEAVTLANRRVGDRYIFSGYRTDTAPFELTSEGVLYRGDTAHIRVQLGAESLHQVSVNGAEVFGALGAKVTGAADLDPALDMTADGTRLADLNGGGGVAAGSVRITWTGGTVDVDLSSAERLEDLAALVADATGGGVTVSSGGASGGSLVLSAVGGTITVAEVAGGRTARDLGILGTSAGATLTGADLDPLLTASTKLSSLRGGAGIDPSGFTVTNGTASQTFDSSNWGATVGDLVSALNSSGVNVAASISAGGDRIEIASRLNGPTMTITENGGTSAADLGVLETAGVRADNLFTALIDLRDALRADDQAGIANCIGLIDTATDGLLRARAQVGARIQRIEIVGRRQEDEQYNLTKLLSETNDVDFSRAAMEFQNLRTMIEAALRMAAQSIPLSLVDFL